MRKMTGVAAAMLLASGCSSTNGPQAETAAVQGSPQETGKDCFFLSQVNGFSDAGDDRIMVHTGVNDVYEFKTFGSCPDLNFSEAIAFDQRGPGTICRGIDVDLIVPTAIGPRRCPVSMIRKLTPAEAEAR